MLKNRLAIISVMVIFLLATSPTVLCATPSKTSQYQDTAWSNFVISQNEKTTSDFNDLSVAIENNDYKEIYNAAHRVFIDEGISLEKSKKYNVSPKLKYPKVEFESASSNFKLAGKYYMDAADKLKVGDITGRNTAYKSAVAYSNSGIKHLDNLVKYLDNGSNNTPQTSSDSVYISVLYVGAPYQIPNQEYVKITNKGTSGVNMKGWMIQDDGAKHTYVFPSYTLKAKSTVTLCSGRGTNTANTLYWNKWSFIWNNDGDTAHLYNAQGKLVSTRNS